MPTNTANLALPYPTSAEPPDGPGNMRDLAVKIDSTVGLDTGPWISISTLYSGFTAAGNGVMYRRVGYTVTVCWNVVSDGSGGASRDQGIAIIPSPHRPSGTLYGCGVLSDGAATWAKVVTLD